MKKFAVVYFENEKRYTVIPATWIAENRIQCYWPGKKTRNKSKIQTDPDSVPDDTFSIINCRVIKSYGKLWSYLTFYKLQLTNL